ncbi:MAG: diguanylate cyclase [Methylococcaceae bacterium]|nr:diguanylate cyclase [Methylococcaceae bacterium]
MNKNEIIDFLSQLPLPAAHFNPSGEVVYLNNAFTKLLGYTKADIPTVEAHWSVFFPDVAYREKVQKDWVTMLEKSAKSGVPIQPMFLDIVAKNGEVKKLEVHSLQMGTLAITMWIDFTEKMKAEEERRIAAIAFDSEAGILITDSDGVIIRVNKAFTRLTGYSSEDALGQTPAMLKSGRQDKAFYQRMWSLLLEKGFWHGELWNKRKNGSIYAELLTITAVVSPDGRAKNYVATFSDISQSKAAEAEIHRLAYYDALTQLPNRRLLQERLGQALISTNRSELYGALLFIDLDKFKMLNDTRGHDVGDMLLQQVAERLVSCIRESDTAARLGGDEFVVMLQGLNANQIEAVAQAEVAGEKILATLNQPYLLAGYEHHSTPSIGVTLFSGNLSSSEELLKQADIAMYQSKTDGRNTLRFFDPEMQTIVTKNP